MEAESIVTRRDLQLTKRHVLGVSTLVPWGGSSHSLGALRWSPVGGVVG